MKPVHCCKMAESQNGQKSVTSDKLRFSYRITMEGSSANLELESSGWWHSAFFHLLYLAFLSTFYILLHWIKENGRNIKAFFLEWLRGGEMRVLQRADFARSHNDRSSATSERLHFKYRLSKGSLVNLEFEATDMSRKMHFLYLLYVSAMFALYTIEIGKILVSPVLKKLKEAVLRYFLKESKNLMVAVFQILREHIVMFIIKGGGCQKNRKSYYDYHQYQNQNIRRQNNFYTRDKRNDNHQYQNQNIRQNNFYTRDKRNGNRQYQNQNIRQNSKFYMREKRNGCHQYQSVSRVNYCYC